MSAQAASERSPSLSAYAAVSSVVFAAAAAPIAIRFGQAEGLPARYIILLRLWITVLLMLPIVRGALPGTLRKIDRKTWLWILLAGTVHAAGLTLLFSSLEYTSVLVSSVLRRTDPLWIITLEILILRASFSPKIWSGLGLVMTGGLLVVLGSGASLEGGSNPLLGAALALAYALVNSIYFLIGRYLRQRLPAALYSWLLFAWAAILTSAMVLVLGIPLGGYSLNGYLWAFIVAIIAQLLGHWPLNTALHHFSATFIGIAMQLSLVFAALFAFLWLAEVPTLWQIAGGILVAIGVIIANNGQR